MTIASAATLAALSDVELAPVEMTRVIAWARAADELETAKARELDLRQQLLAAAFSDLQPGTSNLELGAGYQLQAVMRLNHSLEPTLTRLALDEIRATGDVGTHLAERVVRWTPELVISEWKKLPGKIAEVLGQALTSKPGQPSLKLVPPKG